MVATLNAPMSPDDVTRLETPSDRDDASSVQDRRIRELEERVESQAIRRDGVALIVFTLSALALLAGMFSVGLGMRAITESKRNVKVAGATAPPAALSPPHAVLSDFNVGLSAKTFSPGQQAVTISNAGTVPHEMLVFRTNLDTSAYPVDAAGNIIEDGPGITLVSDGENIDPGGTQDRVIDLTIPGKYVFLCNLPGHFKAGMFTQVTVG
jgi:hypothetical protein